MIRRSRPMISGVGQQRRRSVHRRARGPWTACAARRCPGGGPAVRARWAPWRSRHRLRRPPAAHGRASALASAGCRGRDRVAGRIVRRAHEHQLDVPACSAASEASIVERIAPFAPQRHLEHAGALDACAHGVHAEGRRADEDAVDAGAAEGAHQQVDGLVAAAARQRRTRARRRTAARAARPARAAGAPDSDSGRRRWYPPCLAPGQFVGMQAHQRRLPGSVLVGPAARGCPAARGRGASSRAPPVDPAPRVARRQRRHARPGPPGARAPGQPARAALSPGASSSCTVMRRVKSSTDRPL